MGKIKATLAALLLLSIALCGFQRGGQAILTQTAANTALTCQNSTTHSSNDGGGDVGAIQDNLRAKISELSDSLEKDIAESAKQNGFYPEYAAQLKAVKNALLTSRQPAGVPSQTNFGHPPMNGAD
jgi:hypothetical protein